MKVGIIGCGHLGKAFIEGLRKSDVCDSIIACDTDPSRLECIAERETETTQEAQYVSETADVVLLCVPPGQVTGVLDGITIRENTVLLSAAAGISLEVLEKNSDGAQVARIMPNLAVKETEAAIGYACSQGTSQEIKKKTESLLESLGTAVEVEEEHLDAITALSGSGPAYLFFFLKTFKEAGKQLGLDEETANEMAFQTLQGGLAVAESSDSDLEELLDEVCTPGGTTIEALEHLETEDWERAMKRAVNVAFQRSTNLSGE